MPVTCSIRLYQIFSELTEAFLNRRYYEDCLSDKARNEQFIEDADIVAICMN